MKWFDLFPLDWRTGATFVHDWFALGIWVAVLGHILFAVSDGDALDSMIGGTVPAAWARTKAPLWYEELRSITSAAWTPTPRSPPPATTSTRARHELEALVRIPSISADPAHDDDVDVCADAVAHLMRDAGLDDVRELRVDGGHPYVVGEWTHDPAPPTVLLYAHHDVQPAGLRRPLVVRSVRTASSATAGSSAAAPPTTRRARSRTSPRCAPGCAPPASSPAT